MGGSGARTIAVAAMHTGAPITLLGEIKTGMLGLIADGPDFPIFIRHNCQCLEQSLSF
jgi:hypothetical protein